MGQTVWCVFQKLPGGGRPTLAAVCASQEVADRIIRLSEEDERVQGLPASTWSCGAWSVLDHDLAQLEEIQRMSEGMEGLREGTLPPEGEEDGEGSA